MKNLILVLTLFVLTIIPSVAQEIPKDSVVYIAKLVDDLSDDVYYVPSESILLLDRENDKGFRVNLSFKGDDDKTVKISGVDVKSVGIGGCVEKSQLIILLENGEKVTLNSWNKFNCDGLSYFFLRPQDELLLSSQPITKIRFQNGRTYDNLTMNVPKTDREKIIQTINALKSKDIRVIKI
jgi:hypothetical protein